MQHPLLNLGLIGFSADQQAALAQQLALNRVDHIPAGSAKKGATSSPPPHPIWHITEYNEANALLFNADHISWSDAHDLRFHVAGDASDSGVLGIRPSELTMPYAISGDMPPAVAEMVAKRAPNTMLHDPRSIIQTLQYFEAALRPLRSLFALANLMHERRDELDAKHTFHIERNGTLDAIIDVPRQRVMVRDGLRPFDLDESQWLPRPMSANSLPPNFSVWGMQELAWLMAMHRHTPSIPDRYYAKPIYLSRVPKVRTSLLMPRHSVLLEMLGQQGWQIDQLAPALACTQAVLVRDLNALYVCRAITTTVGNSVLAAEASVANPQLGQESSILTTGMGYQLPTMAADLR
jgi:hypothetical protein